MRLLDRFKLRDKPTEGAIRELDSLVDKMANSNTLNKENFVELQLLTIELFVKVFKRLEDNRLPARTLLDFNAKEVQDACLRVGPSKVFDNDRDFVIAVMQELTK